MNSTLLSRLSLYLTTLCAVAYALVAHLAIARQSIGLTITAVALLAGTTLLPPLLHGRLGAWLGVPVTAALCWGLSKADSPILLLYLPPVLGTLFMAWVFGHTLAQGRTPLIAQFVKLLHPPGKSPDPAVWQYARRLTAAWMWLFLILTALDLVLAAMVRDEGLLALAGVPVSMGISQESWSLFANVLQYLLVGAFFVMEYFYRAKRFPDQPHSSIFDFIRRTIAASPRLLRDENAEKHEDLHGAQSQRSSPWSQARKD